MMIKALIETMPSPNGLEDNYLQLDVSGTVFKLNKLLMVQKFPNGLLAKLVQVAQQNPISEEKLQTNGAGMLQNELIVIESNNRVFVQRSPFMFEIILQCYITGELHVPYWMCRESVMQEINFWKLNVNTVCCACCSNKNAAKDNAIVDTVKIDPTKLTDWQRMKMKASDFFEDTKSSRAAVLYAVSTMTVICISILNLVLSSIPEFQLCPANGTTVYSVADASLATRNVFNLDGNVTDDAIESVSNNTIEMKPEGVLRFFSNCRGMQISEVIEMSCVAWFTVEFLLRIWACPNKCEFMKMPLNVIDFIATFRYYVELGLWALGFDNGSTLLLILRIVRTSSILRILKLGRYHDDLRILGETLLSARKEISMLFIFISVTLLMYSSLVFQLEKDVPNTQFVSIPASLWWSIVTLTTVGYGDVFPVTVLGKIVGGCACVTGILIVGLPMSVLVETFNSKYKRKSSPMFAAGGLTARGGTKFS